MGSIMVHFNTLLFLGLIAAALLDLYLRYFAFGRIESVAIDLGLYTTAYSASELAHDHSEAAADSPWLPKFVICGLVLLFLMGLNSVFRRQVEEKTRDLIEEVGRDLDETGRDELQAASKIIVRSVLLALEVRTNVRQGKVAWRREALGLLNLIARNHPKAAVPSNAGESGLGNYREESVLLGPSIRRVVLAAYAIGGATSLLTPVLLFSKA